MSGSRRVLAEEVSGERFNARSKRRKAHAAISRLDAFSKQDHDAVLECRFGLFRRHGQGIQCVFEGIKENSQFGYIFSGNSPFGNSVLWDSISSNTPRCRLSQASL